MEKSPNEFEPNGPPVKQYDWPRWAVWIIEHIRRLIGCVDELDKKVDEHDKCLIKLKASSEHHPASCPASTVKVDLQKEVSDLKLEFTRALKDEEAERKILATKFSIKSGLWGLVAGAIPVALALAYFAIRHYMTAPPHP